MRFGEGKGKKRKRTGFGGKMGIVSCGYYGFKSMDVYERKGDGYKIGSVSLGEKGGGGRLGSERAPC